MKDFVNLLDKVKSAIVPLWAECGVPPSLQDTLASHIVEEMLIAYKLASIACKDPGKVLTLVLSHEVAQGLVELREAREEFSTSDGLEAILARLSHELALVVQAKRYARMGLKVENVLKEHVSKVLDEAARIEDGGIAQAVHEILSA
ncbi:MAG: hypothetical protein NZ954_03650 [Thermofilaceae archaeon]|nr:hypothetical protein [Thermofilaceae archaeon]MCX8181367.1 hypothetical protein [Thermofilaceae archaeon]MDW8004673.1 hypothetical protein [Thermofilaceae archaeon]